MMLTALGVSVIWEGGRARGPGDACGARRPAACCSGMRRACEAHARHARHAHQDAGDGLVRAAHEPRGGDRVVARQRRRRCAADVLLPVARKARLRGQGGVGGGVGAVANAPSIRRHGGPWTAAFKPRRSAPKREQQGGQHESQRASAGTGINSYSTPAIRRGGSGTCGPFCGTAGAAAAGASAGAAAAAPAPLSAACSAVESTESEPDSARLRSCEDSSPGNLLCASYHCTSAAARGEGPRAGTRACPRCGAARRGRPASATPAHMRPGAAGRGPRQSPGGGRTRKGAPELRQRA